MTLTIISPCRLSEMILRRLLSISQRSLTLCCGKSEFIVNRNLSFFECRNVKYYGITLNHAKQVQNQAEWRRGMAKKSKSKGGKPKKSEFDELIDELNDDDDEDEEEKQKEEPQFLRETDLSRFIKSTQKLGSSKKASKGPAVSLRYEELLAVTPGEQLWTELQTELDKLRQVFMFQLTLRSATSLDHLQVELEGDTFPLSEIAAISKKDPKKLIVDASAFPQSAQNIMTAIRNSGMNLNPQQDGLTILVPIPRVTKEFREKLAAGARRRFIEFKDDLRNINNKYSKAVNEREGKSGMSKDHSRAAVELIKIITDHFVSLGDQLLVTKSKELLGK